MQTDALLLIVRETVDKVTFCFAVTAGENGEANARIVQPRKLQEDWTVDFTTNRRCRKFREMEKSGKLTLAYQYDPDRAYLCLVGSVRMIGDVELKRSRWSPDADKWNPGGPEDPNVVICRLETDRIELWNSVRSVMPEPKGFSAAVLIRDGLGWRYEAT